MRTKNNKQLDYIKILLEESRLEEALTNVSKLKKSIKLDLVMDIFKLPNVVELYPTDLTTAPGDKIYVCKQWLTVKSFDHTQNIMEFISNNKVSRVSYKIKK